MGLKKSQFKTKGSSFLRKTDKKLTIFAPHRVAMARKLSYLLDIFRYKGHSSELFPNQRCQVKIKWFSGAHRYTHQYTKERKHLQIRITYASGIQQKPVAHNSTYLSTSCGAFICCLIISETKRFRFEIKCT